MPDIKVMSALALETPIEKFIRPVFASHHADSLSLSWDPTTVLLQRIEAGERADVLVIIDDAMDDLEARGIVRRGTRVALAEAYLGVGMQAGATAPPIGSLEDFRESLRKARSVAFSRAGASGIYFAHMIAELGIAEEVTAKATIIPAGFTGEKVVSGEAELAIQQVSELMSVDGIEIIGPFPEEVQKKTPFSVALFEGCGNEQGGREFLAALSDEQAHRAYLAGGLLSRLAYGEAR